MRPAGRISAAIEILDEIVSRHRPTSDALSDWGKANRIAGSGDRNAIGGMVYDALRRRSSIAWRLKSDSARALAIGAAGPALGLAPDAVAALCDGSQHAPAPLSADELAGLTRSLDEAPPHVQADIPEWLWPSFERAFGDRARAEGEALAHRAPADLRVNTLKSNRERVLKALAPFAAVPTPLSPVGVRIAPPVGPSRTPNLQAEAAFQAGWFELQDEGSQIAALIAASGKPRQVVDLCAGGGGKTLALAASMANAGQLYAYDGDRLRLQPIFERIKRAGVRNAQVLRARDTAALAALGSKFDLVLVDAPCTGTGVWRRRPDSKWRLKLPSIANRQSDQRDVLALAGPLVKPGGRLVYVTCSILPEENTDQVEAFLQHHPDFRQISARDCLASAIDAQAPPSADGRTDSLLLTPHSAGTDGFFVAVLQRQG